METTKRAHTKALVLEMKRGERITKTKTPWLDFTR